MGYPAQRIPSGADCGPGDPGQAADPTASAAERALSAGVLWPLDTMVKRRCAFSDRKLQFYAHVVLRLADCCLLHAHLGVLSQ